MRKIKSIIIWLTAMVIAIAAIGTASAITSISVSPSTNSVNPGDNFSVDILVNPDTTPIYSGQFTLLFNPAMLQVTALPVSGGFLTQDGATSLVLISKFDNTNGTVDYGEFRFGVSTGVTNPGTLTTVKFHVKNSATPGMSSILNLSDVILSDPTPMQVNAAVNNGSAIIPCNAFVNIAKPTEGQVLKTTTVDVHYDKSGCLNLVSNAQLQLDNNAPVTDNTGNYTFTNVAIGSHTLGVWLVDASMNKLPGAFDMVNFSVSPVTPMVNVTPQQQNVYVGDTVTVSITVDPQTLEVYGAQFDLNYTFPALNATGIAKGPFLTQDGASSLVLVHDCNNTAGQCSYAETRIAVTNGVTTPGTLATITFKANSAGMVPLNLSNVIMTDPSANAIAGVVVNSGSVNVLAIPPTFVNITSPTEGQMIQGQSIPVSYVESGYLANVDHADLQLDNQPVVHDFSGGNYVFNGVNYGSHMVQVWLIDTSGNMIPGAYDNVNFTNVPPTHATKINVTPADTIVSPRDIGSTITINVTLDPDTKESYASSVKLSFNTTMLEANSIVQGNVLRQDGATTLIGVSRFDNTVGTVEYAETRANTNTGVLNPGTLFQIVFTVKPNPLNSISILHLTSGQVVDPNLDLIPGVILNDGIVEIRDKPPVAVAKTNHSMNNVLQLVYLDGSASYDPDGSITKYEWDFGDGSAHGFNANMTHFYGSYKWDGTAYKPFNATLWVTDDAGLISMAGLQITPWIPGDTNGDGAVDVLDLARIGKSWNTHYGDPNYSDGADLNNDNTVNVLDLVILGLHWGENAVKNV